MWRVVALLCLTVVVAQADPNDLTDGVFIVHCPPSVDWSCISMYGGPCEAYDPCGLGIQSCDEQNPQLPTTVPALWYVVAAWSEPKHWCGVEFGFGDYANADNVIFVENNSCPPSALAIPTSGWPGPNEGIALAAYDVDWDGNFRPVYWFATYAYYDFPSVIQLTANPATGFGGFANCAIPPASYPAVAFGALGIFADGIPVCPPEPQPHVCCVGIECYLVTNEGECGSLGGIYHPGWDSCSPNPCDAPPAVCCVGHECLIVWYGECETLGGTWYPEYDNCGPPNPCDIYTPAEPSSWGAIKAIYR